MANNSVDPKIIRCAKQLYVHLGILDQQKSLLQNDLNNLPNEIQKMHRLFTVDPQALSKLVGKFIHTSQLSKQKGTLVGFMETINAALKLHCPDGDDWPDDMSDIDFDLEELIATEKQTIAKLKANNTNGTQAGNNSNITNTANATNSGNTPKTGNIPKTGNTINNNYNLSRKRSRQETTSTQGTTRNSKRPLLDTNPHTTIDFGKTTEHVTPSSADTPQPTSLVEESPEIDYESIIKEYKRQRQNEKNAFPRHNVITSPIRSSGVFENAPWILRFELARLMSACQIRWEDLTMETVQSLIDVAKTRPEQVHDAIMHWYSGLRTNGTTAKKNRRGANKVWSMLLLERCSEMVWRHGLTFESRNGQKPGNEGHQPHHQHQQNQQQKQKQKQQQPQLPRLYDLKLDLSTDKSSKKIESNQLIQQTRSIHYSARVQFPTNNNDEPKIWLNVPEFHASNRFFRKFGGERFLELRISKFRSLDSIRDHTPFFLKPFLLMGVTYRFLFFKDDRLVYFATEGPGLSPISIRSVIDWHLPIIENWGLTICKFASRMGLGYSNSIPTLTFEPENVRMIDDIYATGKTGNESCMTDGCGIISPAAMRKIMGSLQNDILPCAVQGRIGGAKGVWIVPPGLDMDSGDWIEIRASQNKFKTGLPGTDMKMDPLHFTFDLVRSAFCVYPSHLNTQFIQCLSAGGVPTESFIKLLKTHIGNMAEVLTDNKNNRLLRDWLAKRGNLQRLRSNFDDNGVGLLLRKKDDEGNAGGGLDHLEEGGTDGKEHDAGEDDYTSKFNRYSGLPSNLYETLVRLMDAGFDLSNAFMANQMHNVFQAMLRILSTKYRVEVQDSCTVMCIPDPTGTLKKNEVFLQLSGRKVDPKTGAHAGLITGDIIVTRNPCGLKSDIQKVRAVDNSALRVYSDVVVFSIKGSESLASKLGGGDYDGDLIFCCWEKTIVDPFVASPVPPMDDRIGQVLEMDSTKMRNELRNLRSLDDQEAKLQYLFLSAPKQDGNLGLYENWRMIVSEMTSHDNPDVVYLAQMCAILVDAPKQGSKVMAWAKKEDRLKFSGYPVPEWFAEKLHKTWESEKLEPREMKLAQRPLTTAMDKLHATILSEVANLTALAQSLVSTDMSIRVDQDLASPWKKMMEMAEAMEKANNDNDNDNDDNDNDDEDDKKKNSLLVREDLNTLQKAVDADYDEYFKNVRKMVLRNKQKWTRTNRNKIVDSTNEEAISKFDSFGELEEHHAQHFYEMGLADMQSTDFRADVMWNNGYLTQILKASYAYIKTIQDLQYNKYCYVVAYDVLARMKADACARKGKIDGLAYSIIPSIYPAMVIDKRWTRKDKLAVQVDV